MPIISTSILTVDAVRIAGGYDPCTRRNIEICLPLLKVRKTEVGNAKDGLEDNEETRIQAPKGNIESTKPTHSLSLLLLLII